MKVKLYRVVVKRIVDTTSLTRSLNIFPDFKITLHSFICSCPTKDLALTEHLQANWMPVDLTLDRAEADIGVCIRYV